MINHSCFKQSWKYASEQFRWAVWNIQSWCCKEKENWKRYQLSHLWALSNYFVILRGINLTPIQVLFCVLYIVYYWDVYLLYSCSQSLNVGFHSSESNNVLPVISEVASHHCQFLIWKPIIFHHRCNPLLLKSYNKPGYMFLCFLINLGHISGQYMKPVFFHKALCRIGL